MFKNYKYRNIVLIVFSLLFYSWGEPVWVTLLIFSSVLDYTMGLMIERTDSKYIKKLGLVLSVCINLLLLMSFKYYGFLVETFNAISGLELAYRTFSLPVGISFYTFQTMSYTIDVYRGEVKAQKSFAKFLMFVTLYHQLVAGPIVRYADIAEEIDNRRENPRDFSQGINRFVTGLFKKVIIANIAGEVAESILGIELGSLSIFGSWAGILFFALQIYFDFSAYSDMAIGLGMMFGFHYKENFNYPYISKSVTEFWRRWHISLGTFFRDYVYIPLGGNKKYQLRNIFIVWFLTGLWHGASWNFVIWGMYFGVLLLIEKLFLLKLLERLPKIISHIYLIAAVLVGWVFFYFTDTYYALSYFTHMFSFGSVELTDAFSTVIVLNNIYFLVFAMLLSTPVVKTVYSRFFRWKLEDELHFGYFNIAFNALIYVFSIMHLVGQSYNPFLYFRF
ncbi:MAG: MBOAT family O-acyltransferase [Bacillota bacterium]